MADLSQSILRRLRDVRDNPRGVLEQLADQLNNFNKGQVAEINDRGAGMRQLSRDERIRQMVENATDNLGGGGMGALGVIKTKGGQWLSGGVEKALNKLKKSDHWTEMLENGRQPLPEEIQQIGKRQFLNPLTGEVLDPMRMREFQEDTAINNWVSGALARYIKRDMATPNDPIRKLAEEGILHTNPQKLNFNINTHGKDWRPGQTWHGQSERAKLWEGASDNAIGDSLRKDLSNAAHTENPWLASLPPNERIFDLAEPRHFTEDLGFDDLVKSLRDAVSNNADLPEHLRLKPEDFKQMGIEKAIRHIDAINQFRDAQAAERWGKHPAASTFKEYTENNPKGLRWVELKAPSMDDLTPNLGQDFRGRWVEESPEGYLIGRDFEHPEEAIKHIRQQAGKEKLQEILTHEGDSMGHCVGGYCDEVLSGSKRIFSLRDAKGRPHVTIETAPPPQKQGLSLDEARDILAEEMADAPIEEFERAAIELGKKSWMGQMQPRIVQIKGKQNLKPNPEYTPFVQDFIRSGTWEDIKDLSNADLRDMKALYGDKLPEGAQRFMTKEEQQVFNRQYPSLKTKVTEELDNGWGDGWEPDEEFNFAEGGRIPEPNYFDDLNAFLRR